MFSASEAYHYAKGLIVNAEYDAKMQALKDMIGAKHANTVYNLGFSASDVIYKPLPELKQMMKDIQEQSSKDPFFSYKTAENTYPKVTKTANPDVYHVQTAPHTSQIMDKQTLENYLKPPDITTMLAKQTEAFQKKHQEEVQGLLDFMKK